MLEFKPVCPEDSSWIRPLLDNTTNLSCEYSIACLVMWGNASIAECDGLYVPMVNYGDGFRYLRPIGSDDFLPLLPALIADSKSRGIPFRMSGITPPIRQQMEETGLFSFTANRNYFDYVYNIEALTTLSGRKLQAKRNHINRFEEQNPGWNTEPISRENLAEVESMTDRWYQEHYDHGFKPSFYAGELRSLRKAFDHYEAFGFEGLALRVNGELVAWSMGVPLNRDTFDVNFEKAFASMQGAYPLINREFSRMVHAKYPEIRWLDREDDMGEEGLRRAKLSYHPDIILEKSVACLKEDSQ